MSIQYAKTKKGLRIVYSEISYSKKASLIVLVKCGSVHETKNNSGVFHLIEHSLFNGSKKFRTPMEIGEKIDKLGISVEAATYREFTKYKFGFHTKNTEKVIDFIFELLLRPTFEEKLLEKEKKIVLDEVKMDTYDNYKVFYEKTDKLLFKNTPLEKDQAGDVISLKNIKYQTVLDFHKKYYVGKNILIAYVGPSYKIFFKKIDEQFAFTEKGEILSYPKFFINKKNKDIYKIAINDTFDCNSLIFCEHIKNDKDHYLVLLLKTILENKINNFFVSQEKVFYDISVGITEFKRELLLDITFSVNSKDKKQQMNLLKKFILSLDLKKEDLSEANNAISNELDFVKNDPDALADLLVFRLLNNILLRNLNDEKKNFNKISLLELQKFAKKFLNEQNLFTFVSRYKK